MPWGIFSQLLEELRSGIDITERENGKFVHNNIRINKYPFFLYDLRDNIYEAFREFKLSSTDKLRVNETLFGAQQKLLADFKIIFPVGIENWNDTSQIYFIPTEETIIREFNNDFSKAVLTLANVSRNVFLYLESLKYKSRQPRSRPEQFEFTFEISERILHEMCNMLIQRGYIGNETNPKDFINIFKGRKFKNPIRWLKNNYQLKFFISEINKLFDRKYHDGLWHFVVYRFVKHDGSEYLPKSLMRANSKNNSLDFLTHIITFVQENIEN